MTTVNNAYLINNTSIYPPPTGSIVAFLGTTDPDGWVICDGVQRTNGTDGRYNTLITMGVGSGTANVNYTPPNLKGSFLRATGTDPTGNYAGPSVNATQTHATQTHGHAASVSISDSGHSHTFQTYNDDFNAVGGGPGQPSFGKPDATNAVDWNSTNSTTNISMSLASNTTPSSGTFINANETRPYNYGVNWIIKY